MNAQPRTVAEGFLAALADRGVDWVLGNAGTDFAPIIEALAAGLDAFGLAEAASTRARRASLTDELCARRQREVAAGHEPASQPLSPEFMSLTLSGFACVTESMPRRRRGSAAAPCG